MDLRCQDARRLWHFNLEGEDAERLVAGRQRIYLGRFWNEFAGDSAKVDEETRQHYTKLYALPGAMQSTFAQFLSINHDAEQNQEPEGDGTKAVDASPGDRRREVVRRERDGIRPISSGRWKYRLDRVGRSLFSEAVSGHERAFNHSYSLHLSAPRVRSLCSKGQGCKKMLLLVYGTPQKGLATPWAPLLRL